MSPVAHHGNPLAHAAVAVPNHLAFEVQDLSTPLGLDIDQAFDDGGIVLRDRPGLGIVVDESAIAVPSPQTQRAATAGPHVRPERAGLRLVGDVEDHDVSSGGA